MLYRLSTPSSTLAFTGYPDDGEYGLDATIPGGVPLLPHSAAAMMTL